MLATPAKILITSYTMKIVQLKPQDCNGELLRYCDFISEGERSVLICFGYMKREEGKRWLGKASSTILSAMFLMDWLESLVWSCHWCGLDVTGVVLLIVPKKCWQEVEGFWL
ncbi:hypothetical protein CEXT_602051 [Caerostris extrusa]|uniref:Uncharacterized protein n=1 Tax=Caerostris extrusa TaxID=172846 RepID=A0AAV4PWT1_CAEEX|nr:hypothetical protein CEXT_602051 [Caerostris extrusa]